MEKFPEKFNLPQPTQNEIGNWESPTCYWWMGSAIKIFSQNRRSPVLWKLIFRMINDIHGLEICLIFLRDSLSTWPIKSRTSLFTHNFPTHHPPLIKRTPDTISPTTLGNLHFLSGPTSTWVTKPIHCFHYIPLISTRSSPSLANSAWTTDT